MENRVIELKGVSISARTKRSISYIIQDMNFTVNAGEMMAIVGESGCGKTMTAMSILGLLPSNCNANGEILLENKNLLALRKREIHYLRGRDVVLIPQNGSEFLNPVLKVRYQIFETLRSNGMRSKKEMEKKAVQLLREVGFADPKAVLDQYPFQLSGGMAQRVILAIGLSSSPKLVIADEPTRGVDNNNTKLFLDQLNRVFTKSAVIIITHSIDLALQCDKLLVMYAGRVMEYGNSDMILSHTTHPYTKNLISALPSNGFQVNAEERCDSQEEKGCPFYSMCPKAAQKCAEEIPPLVMTSTGQRRCYFG